MMKHCALYLSLVFLFACNTANKNMADIQMPQSVRDAIEKREFTIQVNDMAPQRYHSRILTSPYDIKVKDGLLYSNLPYLGQVQTPSVYTSTPKGLNFIEEIKEFSFTDNTRKKRVEITIKVRNEEDAYVYQISISYNADAEVIVRPMKRDFIRFYGQLTE